MLLLLLACPGPVEKPVDDTAPADADTDTDADTDADTDTIVIDEDRDGHDAASDCNDNNYQIYPGAPEDCDGVDDDCDELIDEDFDADEDGAMALACDGGTDCDDTDDTIAPGAPEVPYDAVDQDCDGADLTDVDGDGYDGNTAFDCDDDDASVHVGAEELPKDGIDQDCDGADVYDGDGDGYDDEAWGGDDCDDVDAAVHPGVTDWWNDGVDSDCDGHDNGYLELGDAPVSILGVSGQQDLVGQEVTVCDIDGDSLLDLVITAPFGDTYAGQIGIFYGDGVSSWSDGMLITDADTLITSREQFLGFDVGCDDLDGDGDMDLVAGRGEIHYTSAYDADFELVIWYGEGAKFDAELSEIDAGVRMSMPLGVTNGLSTVYGRDITVGDLDGDGAAEIVLVNALGSDVSEPDDAFYVIGGGTYSGNVDLVDEVSAMIAGDGVAAVVTLPDLDGDGVSELLLGEPGWTGDTTDTGDTGTVDTGDTGSPYIGRASVLNGDGLVTGAVGDLAYGFWEGTGAEELGFSGAVGDFDGDGLQDVAVTALADDTVAEYAGTVYLFAPAEGVVAPDGVSTDGDALRGDTADAYFGYQVRNATDIDGDGAEDLLISELYAESGYGRLWLMGGARSFGGSALSDAALTAWIGEQADALTGNSIAIGDLDNDGAMDFVVAAYGFISSGTSANGKVYVVLSGG